MNLSKYIGREYSEYNCFDLVKEFYKDQFGLEVKNYFDSGLPPGKEELACLIDTNKGDFCKVDKPEFGDIVVIKILGRSSHIGVYINRERFLHSSRRAGSCLDSLSRYSKTIEGFYRHQELTA